MKIAIMTQPLGENYGGIMQAWALQQVLKSEGHEVVTIDRRADEKGFFYHLARLGYRSLQKALGKRKAPINLEKYLSKIFEHTNAFVVQNLSMSEPLDSTEKLKAHFDRENYDVVIVGSDQTWRPMYSPNIGNFFLDFLQDKTIKRIAYASSFGVDEWEFTEEQTKYCAPLAQNFDAVSVREDSGIDLCKNFLGVDATHVQDPTLLLERSDYESLFEGKGIPKRSGICTYILDDLFWKRQVLENAQKILSLPCYTNNSVLKDFSKFTPLQCEAYKLPCVESWIQGFADADFIITDSFHGTVFSIIFNKPFVSLINPGRGVSRFYSLLKKMDLSNRMLCDFDQERIIDLLNDSLDYKLIMSKICSIRYGSKLFINSNINDF